MKKILIINGPNLNMLGIREPKKYGKNKLSYINNKVNKRFEKKIKLFFFQSNSEEKIIKKIHKSYRKINYIIINPAGFSYNSYSILDAIISINIKYIEVHITNIFSRKYRKKSIFSRNAICVISGMGYMGYISAIEFLVTI
ncbi:type II 3-dehydroquinate dehydratase [Candidatus Vidania fulgoroideae]|uniref:3-dehydroquinate dehydratase n=1 Tax=Candidatus Vidania fulgoroideorum TaxID=881286 RepID=A0AAX3N8J1_9PROT|nr:type II 3-dehydroquinate dehydratase [Candidatus Vidania fulgoroideae]